MLTDPTFIISMAQNERNYFIGLYMCLFIGGVMLIVPFLGCCGAFKESQCMLSSFFSCLLVVIVAELAVGAWAYHNSEKLNTFVRSAVKEAVQDEYSVVATRTTTLDSIQKYLHCCGADGPNDWQSSVYNNVDRSSVVNIAISKLNVGYKVPESCCIERLSIEDCNKTRNEGRSILTTSTDIYTEGCSDKLINEVKRNTVLLYAISATIVGIEILALLFAVFLCCAIRRKSIKK